MVWLTDRTRRSALVWASLLAIVVAAPAGALAQDGEPIELSIAANAIAGGKNEAEALWIENYVIPTFEQMMADQGTDVTVSFEGRGVDDEDFKAQLALDLGAGAGDDVISIDGIWVGEFAQAGFIAPLDQVVGPEVGDWEGWGQIPEAVQGLMAFEGQRYGVPAGTDGRILYYRKDLFEQAGLPTDWQPTSWQDVLDAARQLKEALPEVTPLQINAGVPMGEATTMQGVLPLLVGTGERIYDEETGMWLGDTPELRQVLQFYADVYQAEQLGDADLQLRQDGRDRSFQDFAEGRIAILLEGDFLWRGVIHPETGTAPIADREEIVGWAKIPAREPGGGIDGQDFVSMSGGGGRVLNPNTEHPAEAWELLAFMNSRDAVLEFVEGQVRITQRQDVNDETLAQDPLLIYVSEEVLPVTATRPGLAVYPQVSQLLQVAVEDAASGDPVEEAAQRYQSGLEELVGADNVASGG
ncbi:N/A [soil metagenome]